MRALARCITAWVFLASTSTCALGFAQVPDEVTRAAARGLGNAGVKAYQEGRNEEAVEKLDMAYSVVRVPSLGLWLARALARGGRLVEAAERYREAADLPIQAGNRAVQAKAKAEAVAELEPLLPRIPQLIFQLEGANSSELSVLVDGRAVPASATLAPYPVDPGEHEIEAKKGQEIVRTKVRLAEGQSETVQLRFAPPPPAAPPPAAPPPPPPPPEGPSTARTLGWAAAIAGGASLAAGALTGVLAASQRSAILDDPNCEDNRCPPSQRDEADSLDTLRTVSSVAFIAGGLLAGTGIVLLLTSESTPGPRAEAFVCPTSAGVRGRF
jgi:hypothetical protein